MSFVASLMVIIRERDQSHGHGLGGGLAGFGTAELRQTDMERILQRCHPSSGLGIEGSLSPLAGEDRFDLGLDGVDRLGGTPAQPKRLAFAVDVLELNRVSAIATVENRCHESLWEEAGQQQVGFSVSATLPPVKSGLILPSVVAA